MEQFLFKNDVELVNRILFDNRTKDVYLMNKPVIMSANRTKTIIAKNLYCRLSDDKSVGNVLSKIIRDILKNEDEIYLYSYSVQHIDKIFRLIIRYGV